MTDDLSDDEFRLILKGITKQYPSCLANDSVEIRIMPGKNYALLGKNGAGKSTLMKVIYGVVKPDADKIIREGGEIEISAPVHARKLAIGMVFQHFSLFETLSVLENIALCMEKDDARDMDALARKITEVSQKYGMALEPHRPVHNWGPLYAAKVKAVMDGTWTSEDIWGEFADDALTLAPFNAAVPRTYRTT